ncbi:acetate/propionate family kinase [Flavimaricola marinus]|uniref:Acetate kinase n=1 Tax=Flavimaricola marinus TaxID=1819565 RepID=A0A238LAV7_9RHOB|nr:acetate kinase [Flavimaricola marinus]SMY06702.1 Acetate kinase [Flavimaricola marinus]
MILVLNAGSSSLKAELFDSHLTSLLTASISEIGSTGKLKIGDARSEVSTENHADALSKLLAALTDMGHGPESLTAAAHRVVHGGATLTAPVRLTAETIQQIEDCIPLAPLHNPANLAAIMALRALTPDLPQFASFDTAFHASNAAVATTYAIPAEDRATGLRRYGFHGLSYASLVTRIDPLPARLLALHLGNGASLCAIKDGKSVASSMGYSPLDGLTMGTRSGAIDGMAVLAMAEAHGIDEANRRLNRESGLKALAGTNDMAEILSRSDADARFAAAHFSYWAARHAGSAIVAMGGVDAVAFTGGIGENAAPIRDAIMDHLAFLGPLPVHVIEADEERQIARDALALLTA